MKKDFTVVYLYNAERILLAMKKRGFGAGWWNGYGGKVAPGETIAAAAARELMEESGIVTQLTPQGKITYHFKGDDLVIHFFHNANFNGTAIETEEMRPEWFSRDGAIPYEKMWPSDTITLPRFLNGEFLEGDFWLRDDGSVERHELREWGRAS